MASAEPARQSISLEELSALAHTIIQSGVEVPPAIVARTKQAITLRRRCAILFSSIQYTASGPDDHECFIHAFEVLCERLEQAVSKEAPNRDRPNEVEASFADAESDMLQRDQIYIRRATNLRCDETDFAKTTSGQIEIQEGASEKVNAHLQLFFHLFCLLEDLSHLRKYVSQSVQEYVAGKIDLANVAVVADNAISLATQLIDEVTATWPQHREPGNIQRLVYIAACCSRAESVWSRPDPTLAYNSNMEDIAAWCYLPATSVLISCTDILERSVSEREHRGTYGPSACRDRMSTSAKLEEDVIILLELLPEFALIGTCNIALPAEDEITRALVAFTHTKEITLSLSFATQIFLDVHHGLRHTRSKAYSDLTLTGLRISKTLQEYWAISQASAGRPKYWPKEAEECILGLRKSIDTWLVEDVFINARNSELPGRRQKEGPMKRHILLRSHGILCGLTMFHFTLSMHYISTALINQWQGVPQMAYVYNIVQRTGFKGIRWPDMDAFIAMHGEEHGFTRRQLWTSLGPQKELCLPTVDRNPSKMRSISRDCSGKRAPYANPRRMESRAAFVDILHEQYLTNGQIEISIENIEELMKEIAADNSCSNDQVSATTWIAAARQQWDQSHQLGILHFLAALKQGMYIEEPRLQFNYIGLYRSCIELLRLIQAKGTNNVGPDFCRYCAPEDTTTAGLSDLVLAVAQRDRPASQRVSVPIFDGVARSGIVSICGEAMEEFLATNGDKACKELRTFCKNQSLTGVKGLEARTQEAACCFNLEEVAVLP